MESKPCRSCGVDLPLSDFARFFTKGREYYRKDCHACYEKSTYVKVSTARLPRDVKYDYAFARTVLNWGHWDTLRWLARGYNLEVDSLRDMIPNRKVEWKPDRIKEDA